MRAVHTGSKYVVQNFLEEPRAHSKTESRPPLPLGLHAVLHTTTLVSYIFERAQLGICTADGSLRLSVEQHVERFFTNPAAHCVGYGRLAIKSLKKAKAEDVVQSKRPSAPLAPRASVGEFYHTVTESSVGATSLAEAVAEEVDQGSKSSPHFDPSLISSACLDLEVSALAPR